MKSSMYGTLTLAAFALAACSGNPLADEQKGANVIVDPGFLQINVGSSQTVTVQLVDDQGNALPAAFSATANDGAVVAVAESIGYRPGLGNNRLASIFRVSALSIDSSSVTFTAGGKSYDVPVKVSPLNVPLVLGAASFNVNDTVNLSAPGFKFLPGTQIIFGGSQQFVVSRAADSSSMTIRLGNAVTNGNFDIQGIAVGYLPSIGLNLLSAATQTVGPAITAFNGTDAIATAPDIYVPADGSGRAFTLTDVGTFNASADCTGGPGGAPCRIYKLVLPTDQAFDISSTWTNNTDLGIYISDVSNAGTSLGAACDAHGTGAAGANFETCTADLTAGTYYVQVVTFTAFYAPPNDVDPTSFTVTLTAH
ncbi:MAG: hypothetical protein IPK12_02455 [Gemmatimonadetes bacterium]|nr:hypothetical protein [Gemmatimonadota bacterium]